MKLPALRSHHLVVGGLLAVLAAASLLLRGPVKGSEERSIPTTFSTEPRGLQGLLMLAEGVGLPAGRYTGRLEDLDPDVVPALVVAGRPKETVDLAPLLAYAEAGGRLLLATADERLLGALRLRHGPAAPGGTAWFAAPGRGWEIPAGAGPPVSSFSGEGLSGAEVLARSGGAEGLPWILARDHGAGSVVLLADVAPLTNAGIETPANAVLAVRLLEATAEGERIAFCETVHGYGGGGNPHAAMVRILLRTPFGNAALAASAFVLLLLVAEAKRFGRVRRFLDRPRRSEYEYLDALAGLLVRAGAWPQAGKLLLLGVARRSGREREGRRRRERLTVRAVADALAWDRPGDAAALRAGADALAAGRSPAEMAAGLGTLDRALPPERPRAAGGTERRRA